MLMFIDNDYHIRKMYLANQVNCWGMISLDFIDNF